MNTGLKPALKVLTDYPRFCTMYLVGLVVTDTTVTIILMPDFHSHSISPAS